MTWQRIEYNSPIDGKTHVQIITLGKISVPFLRYHNQKLTKPMLRPIIKDYWT